MTYVVRKTQPEFRQISVMDFLFCDDDTNFDIGLVKKDYTSTKTFVVDSTWQYRAALDINNIIECLKAFNNATEHLRAVDRHSLYKEFYIPKKSGGLRKIDAPNDELKGALRLLKGLIEEKCTGTTNVGGYHNSIFALYHTSAFAYIKKRCFIHALRKHQQNDSHWFAKFDLSNFFGSTTLDYTIKMFKMVFPFNEIMRTPEGEQEFRKAIELAFLDGGLPQGTPISPLITNIIMIPVDFELYNGFRKFEGTDKNGEMKMKKCVYTRYADDFLISSKYDFKFTDAQEYINNVLQKFGAPFQIKAEKTRYGSRSGSNWNLGLMLGQDNKITIGYKKKKVIKSMLANYAMDKKKGIRWSLNDIQVMEGYRNFYRMVEPEDADGVVEFISKKHGVDIISEIKNDLRAA